MKENNSNKNILDQIETPKDLKSLKEKDLLVLSKEVRDFMIDKVSETGGHLGAGLGVVELTIALHYIFDTPKDRIVWDVGHQTYPHKIITKRKNRLHTLRQGNGLSGFTKRSESIYDPFGAAHASTSISAALGMLVASKLKKQDRKVVAVIGDGAMTAGMAFEALNNAGAMKDPLIVILNDNDMSIAPPVGAMSAYLSKLISSGQYRGFRHAISQFAKKLPKSLANTAKKTEEYIRGFFTGGTLFEELGFYYIGPIDGHNFKHLIPILKNARNHSKKGPVLIHVVTKKGKGYIPAEQSQDKFHGVGKFDRKTGLQNKTKSNKSFTAIFSETLINIAKKDRKICGITAAMPSGTGIDKFKLKFPSRSFDVGIAEQHAVTFAAGLASEGMKPYVAIYSTFLQRAYDQIVHDVAIQKLPVRFAIDRAGQVGSDGPTHAGSFDITYLSTLPNFTVMAPSSESELIKMMNLSLLLDDHPSAFRYPRGMASTKNYNNESGNIEIGKGYIVRQGNEVAILNLGTRLDTCMEACSLLNKNNIFPTIADARFAKPIDTHLIDLLVENHKFLITIEEGSIGGFSSHVLNYIHNVKIKKNSTVIKNIIFPDKFIEHMRPEEQYKEMNMDVDSIVKMVFKLYDQKIIDIKNFTSKI